MVNEVKENRSILVFFFINLATKGLFILWFTLLIFSDSDGLKIFAFICFLLSIIAAGVYQGFFEYSWISDINEICDGDGESTPRTSMMSVLSFITCGIYKHIWVYNLQNRLNSNAVRYGVVIRETGSTVLLWRTLGTLLITAGPLLAQHIMLQSTNKLAYAYNHNSPAEGVGRRQDRYEPYTPPQLPPEVQNNNQGMGANPILPAPPQVIQPVNPPVKPAQPAVMGTIQCTKGAALGQGFRLPANSKVVVGKNSGKATMVINDSRVSNVHCSIQYNAVNNTYVVTDHSTNGTFINGVRIQKDVPVSCPAGTKITLVDGNNEIKLG